MADKTYWVCENKKCRRLFTTDQEDVRRRCDCGLFMKTVTAKEFHRLRLELIGVDHALL